MVKEIKAGILVLGIICFACGCGRTETAQTEAMTENVRKINTEAVEENLTQVINNIRTEDVNRKQLLSDTGFISWEEAGLEEEAVDWKDAELEDTENYRHIQPTGNVERCLGADKYKSGKSGNNRCLRTWHAEKSGRA